MYKFLLYIQNAQIRLDKSGRATGVWYLRHGVKKFARATKETIVSGGTIGSAQLLMLSGIGPKEHLKSVGVSCTACANFLNNLTSLFNNYYL